MWNFLKTSVSVLGLFIILVLLAGMYSSLVQEPVNEKEEKESNYEKLPNDATSTNSATSSDFIDIESDEPILEDIPTY